MAGPSETLAFALSEGDIKAALDLLRGRRPKNSYIQLARDAFEALPPEVRELLRRAHDGGKQSSHAGSVIAQSRGG
jgi:hypothetical protein